MQCDPIDTESCLMKTLIHTRIYALLTQNESNPSELAHAYEEFIETMTEMVANFDNRDDILRILYYSRVEFDVLSHPAFNRYSNNVLRTTFIYKIMYILDCEINIVSNSTKYSSTKTIHSLYPIRTASCCGQGRSKSCWSLPLPFIKTGLSCTATARRVSSRSSVPCLLHSISRSTMSMSRKPGCLTAARRSHLFWIN